MTAIFFLLLINSIFVSTDEGLQQIPIIYVDANPSFNGGYGDGIIYLNPDTMWLIDKHCLNVWTHEVLHAWGYSHADMRQLSLCSET